MKIRVLIADDEPLARERIRRFLESDPEIEIRGECGNGLETVAALEELRPDLVFLDIQMPELDGFGVIQCTGVERMPAIVFVTAYDQYAVKAFEAHALDYLLKPFSRERFRQSLAWAKEVIAKGQSQILNQRVLEFLRDYQPAPRYLERIIVKSAGRIQLLKTDESDWFQAAGNYVEIHVRTQIHLIRETMNHLETRLDPARFQRIHRCTIVNLDRIQEIHTYFNNEYVVILKDGAKLTMSRKYKEKLSSLF
ncbi:MAG: LytR/AlgR family response regulator transcription factor [bacterium]